MFLALDIGNSHVVCAIHDAKKWIHNIRISSNLDFWNKFKTLKEYDITDAAISSVVPHLTSVYIESIRNIFHIDTFNINHEKAPLIWGFFYIKITGNMLLLSAGRGNCIACRHSFQLS